MFRVPCLNEWKLSYKQRTPEEELIDFFKGRIIELAGLPGAGKSTLGKQLAQLLNGEYYPEYFQNDLFNMYMSDKQKYAFSYQIIMGRERSNIGQKALDDVQKGKSVVVDGYMACDNAFAKMMWKSGVITDNEYRVYQRVMDSSASALPSPSYTVFLDHHLEGTLERIKRRGRPGEWEAYSSNNFLSTLRSSFLDVLSDQEVIIIPYSDNCVDENGNIPRTRLLEILGLIKDPTSKRIGITPW